MENVTFLSTNNLAEKCPECGRIDPIFFELKAIPYGSGYKISARCLQCLNEVFICYTCEPLELGEYEEQSNRADTIKRLNDRIKGW